MARVIAVASLVPAALWLCTLLVALRVAGQLLVVLRAPAWLPPNERWMSGLVPYRWLLPSQILVLTLMAWMAADLTRGAGRFAERSSGWGFFHVCFASAYFGAMIVRYGARMARRPEERWLGGTIPIFFHSVIAAFMWIFGMYHYRT